MGSGQWSGLDCEIKGSGWLWATFEARFLTFSGWKHYSIPTEKLHNIFFTFCFEPKKWKNQIFRAKIWVEFECKYLKVGNRLLLDILGGWLINIWWNHWSRKVLNNSTSDLLWHHCVVSYFNVMSIVDTRTIWRSR